MSDQLVGTWQLQSWVALDEHGNVEKPFGDHPTGVLVITSDGWLSAQLAASRRQDLAAGSNPLGEPAGQSAAFLTYVAYAGRYRTDGDRVTTTVQVSLIPDWVGSEQVRGIELTATAWCCEPYRRPCRQLRVIRVSKSAPLTTGPVKLQTQAVRRTPLRGQCGCTMSLCGAEPVERRRRYRTPISWVGRWGRLATGSSFSRG